MLTRQTVTDASNRLRLKERLADAVGDALDSELPMLLTTLAYTNDPNGFINGLAKDDAEAHMFVIFIDFARKCNADDRFSFEAPRGHRRWSKMSMAIPARTDPLHLDAVIEDVFGCSLAALPSFLSEVSVGAASHSH